MNLGRWRRSKTQTKIVTRVQDTLKVPEQHLNECDAPRFKGMAGVVGDRIGLLNRSREDAPSRMTLHENRLVSATI